MGVDGWQTLTIKGRECDLDEIEFFFKITETPLKDLETRTQMHKEFSELWDIQYMCMKICRTNPIKMVGWFETQADKYKHLLETEGGALFKQLLDVSRIKQLDVDAMYELRKHTLLTSSVRRASANELIIQHDFRNRPTISFVDCLASYFPLCWFNNYCKIEDGYAEIKIIHSRNISWNCGWDSYPVYCPIPPYEKFGISLKELNSCVDARASNCGCISLGLSKCFMMDSVHSYNITFYVDFSGRLIDDWEKIEQEFKDLHAWLLSKGIEFIGPDGKPYDDNDEVISLEHYKHKREMRWIILGNECTNSRIKTSALHFKCILKEQNPKDLLKLFCRKYSTAYWWCVYEDIEKRISGVLERDVEYHYPTFSVNDSGNPYLLV